MESKKHFVQLVSFIDQILSSPDKGLKIVVSLNKNFKYIISSASKYLTGQDFPVDGGVLAFCY